VLTKEDGKTPLWNATDPWTAFTTARERKDAKVAILTVGAPSYLAIQASDKAATEGVACDVHVVNGFPIDDAFLASLPDRYTRVVTVEDGIIGTPAAGLRGFAAFLAGRLVDCDIAVDHVGIGDPQIAPSETFDVVWAHYGITVDAIASRLRSS